MSIDCRCAANRRQLPPAATNRRQTAANRQPQVRDWIVPTNRRYPLAQLLGALRAAFPYATRKGDDFVVIE